MTRPGAGAGPLLVLLSRAGGVDEVEDIGDDAGGRVIGDYVTAAVSIEIARGRRRLDSYPPGARDRADDVFAVDVFARDEDGAMAMAPSVGIVAVVRIEAVAIFIAEAEVRVLPRLSWRHGAVIIAILSGLSWRHAAVLISVFLCLSWRHSAVAGVVAVMVVVALSYGGTGQGKKNSLKDKKTQWRFHSHEGILNDSQF